MEISIRPASTTSVQTQFAELDMKGMVRRAAVQAAAETKDPAAVSPGAVELTERLAGLAGGPQTPPKCKEPRPVPTLLSKGVAMSGDGRSLGHDSGYSSIASSPEAIDQGQDQQPRFRTSGFPSSKLSVFEKPIPERLKNRFHDLKVLYSDDLLKAVYKKNVNQRDISMKLKYLGKNEPSASLYIVVQCEEKFAKKVKKFFARDNVVEDLRQDFKVHVIKKGLQPLGSSDPIQVYGAAVAGGQTLCGRLIKISNGDASLYATIGGIIQVSLESSQAPTLCGLTAAHPIANLYRANSAEGPPGLEADGSESSDDDDDDDSDDDGNEEDDEIMFGELDDEDFHPGDDHFQRQVVGAIGTILAHSIDRPANLDWALVALDMGEWRPNCLPPTTGDSVLWPLPLPLYCPRVGTPPSKPVDVAVVTCHGPQKGTLEANQSSLFVAPGEKFVQTFDFKPRSESRLRPGDSGSWVVDENSGEVFGYVVSTDALGEAHVVRIQDTLHDIQDCLEAADVVLPTEDQIRALHPSLGLPGMPGISWGAVGLSHGYNSQPSLAEALLDSSPSTFDSGFVEGESDPETEECEEFSTASPQPLPHPSGPHIQPAQPLSQPSNLQPVGVKEHPATAFVPTQTTEKKKRFRLGNILQKLKRSLKNTKGPKTVPVSDRPHHLTSLVQATALLELPAGQQHYPLPGIGPATMYPAAQQPPGLHHHAPGYASWAYQTPAYHSHAFGSPPPVMPVYSPHDQKVGPDSGYSSVQPSAGSSPSSSPHNHPPNASNPADFQQELPSFQPEAFPRYSFGGARDEIA